MEIDRQKYYNGNMTSKDKLQEKFSTAAELGDFSELVDKACDSLMDCQANYSIRKLNEMAECLCQLEHELDVFLEQKDLPPENRES